MLSIWLLVFQTRSGLHQHHIPIHAHPWFDQPVQRLCILWRNNIRLYRVELGAFLRISNSTLRIPHCRQWAIAEPSRASIHSDKCTEATILCVVVSHSVRLGVAMADDHLHRGNGDRCNRHCETILVWHTDGGDATVSQGIGWIQKRRTFHKRTRLIIGDEISFTTFSYHRFYWLPPHSVKILSKSRFSPCTRYNATCWSNMCSYSGRNYWKIPSIRWIGCG